MFQPYRQVLGRYMLIGNLTSNLAHWKETPVQHHHKVLHVTKMQLMIARINSISETSYATISPLVKYKNVVQNSLNLGRFRQ